MMLFRLTDRGTWVAEGLLGCAYPRTERALAALSDQGVQTLVNLHTRPHDPRRLTRHRLKEIHLPVEDFAAPSPEQIARGVEAVVKAQAAGEAAAVHCGGGLGRTGTLLACCLVSRDGLGAREAIERVRFSRPGSVETAAQVAAVEEWARRSQATSSKEAGSVKVARLDHVQLAMPKGKENEAREYFGDLLGLREIEKPPNLAKRGGVWFALPDGRQLHLGVEEPFSPNKKAHPAFATNDLDKFAAELSGAGYPVEWDEELAPLRRFYCEDPFGNRIEFLEAESGE